MALKKKAYLLLAAIILFWIIFIAWGMFKTGVKLSRDKSEAEQKLIKKATQQQAAVTETKPEETKTRVTESQKLTPQPPQTEQPESRLVLVRTFKVKSVDFQDSLPVMGTVKGKTEMELKFEMNGVIKNINFREGEMVKKGDLIACLDSKDAELRLAYGRNKLNSAEAAFRSVEKKLEVHKKLFESGAIIKSKLEVVQLECESARFQMETTRSEMELAENEMKKTCLYANKEGVMGPREAEEGEFITPQDKIGSLIETNNVFVEVGVVERDIYKVKVGQKAKVYVDAWPNITFEGTVDNIYPVVEGKSRTLTIKIKVENPEGKLIPGMFSRADILIIEIKDGLIVPASCLIPTKGGVTLVPVIPASSLQKGEEDTQVGTVQLRKVDLGYVTSDYAQISQGVSPEDLVVIEAQGELKDNTRVRIVGTEEMGF